MANQVCSFLSSNGESCSRAALTRGWCQTHYRMWLRGEPLRPIRLKAAEWRRCEFDGCDKLNSSGGLCVTHATQRDAGLTLTAAAKTGRQLTCSGCPHDWNATCDFKGCDKAAKSHGLCVGHSSQRDRGQTLRSITRLPAGSLTRTEQIRRYNEGRRARLESAEKFQLLERDWRRTLERWRFKCAYCRQRPATERDHVISLRRGGSHGIGNLLPVCRFCNRSKNARLLIEWKRRPPYRRLVKEGAFDGH